MIEEIVKKMDKLYYFENKAYININFKNNYMLKDKSIEDIIIWDNNGNLVDKYKLYKGYSWKKFINKVLMRLKYKVFMKVRFND